MSVPLKQDFRSSVGNENIELTGNIAEDIAIICENLRISLYEAVEQVKEDALDYSSEYTQFSILPGRTRGARMDITFVASRAETQQEMGWRLAKEAKARKTKEAKDAVIKKKELVILHDLATKHGMVFKEEKNE